MCVQSFLLHSWSPHYPLMKSLTPHNYAGSWQRQRLTNPSQSTRAHMHKCMTGSQSIDQSIPVITLQSQRLSAMRLAEGALTNIPYDLLDFWQLSNQSSSSWNTCSYASRWRWQRQGQSCLLAISMKKSHVLCYPLATTITIAIGTAVLRNVMWHFCQMFTPLTLWWPLLQRASAWDQGFTRSVSKPGSAIVAELLAMFC